MPALVLPEPMPALPPKNAIDSAFVARIDARPTLSDAPKPPPRPVESHPPRAEVAEVRTVPFTPADPSVNATMRLEPPRIVSAQRHSGTELPADATLATGAIAPVRINYVVRNQPLDHVLREIGHLAGISVVASSGIRVTLREKRLDGTADRIFDQLARDHALFWFLDGATAYVDPLDQQKTRFFKVKGASQAVLTRAIDAAGLGKYRDRIQLSGKDGLVRVSGPDTFTRTVESALASTEVESTTINVIRFGQKGH